MRRRIFRDSSLGTAPSASWKVTSRPWLTTLAPISTSFSRSVVSDHVCEKGRMSAKGRGCVKTRQVGELAQQSNPRDREFISLLLRTETPSALLTNVVADHAAREAGQDRREGGPARSVCHFPVCRGGDSTTVVRGDPATDRRPAAEASTDMTPYLINAVGFNRRAPDPPQLPNGRLLTPDRTMTWSRMHRAAHPKPPDRVEWPRFRSILDCAIVFGAWEEPSGKSRLTCSAGRSWCPVDDSVLPSGKARLFAGRRHA